MDAEGTERTATREALVSSEARRARVAGRHGLWFAFRTQYPDATVVDGGD